MALINIHHSDSFIKALKTWDNVKFGKFVYAGIGAAAVIAAVIIFQSDIIHPSSNVSSGISAYTLDFTYAEVNSNLKSTLETQGIKMSDPLKFNTKAEITQYCSFLSNKTKQAMIEYCTSTEIKDKNGNFLGNLNMVGSSLAPALVIAATQTDPNFSNYQETKTLFGDVVNETICKCWSAEKPGNYTSISAMMDALRDFHLQGKQPASTTHGIPLKGKHFEVEITTNDKGYVWKLLVAK